MAAEAKPQRVRQTSAEAWGLKAVARRSDAGSAACAAELDNKITVTLVANNPMPIPTTMMPASSSQKGGGQRSALRQPNGLNS